MKTLRVALVAGVLTALMGLGAAPAIANDCSDTKPGQQCGGCRLNPNFSTEDLRPIVCYV